jgi:LacI family transcriptional regulator
MPVLIPASFFRSIVNRIMSRSKATVTIHDVAQAAGVSVSTVSRVLNNKVDVAPETYQTVQCVIERLGYTSSLAARSLRSRRTNVIGLVLFDIVDPFSVQIMSGVDQLLKELNYYDLIVYSSVDSKRKLAADRERRSVSLLDNSITDGLIVVAPSAVTFANVSPIVIIDPHIENPNYPAVIAQNREGALSVVQYLTSLEHQRIGFIGGRPELQSAIQRLQGYTDGLAQAGLPLDPDLIQSGDYSKQIGFIGTQKLLSLPQPPTAIFASNDQSAFGVLEAAHEAGLRVPDDLSVIGFDNIPEAAYSTPPLTTVDQSIEQMGYLATQVLIRLISEGVVEKQTYFTSTHLVVRESCKPVITVPKFKMAKEEEVP